VVLRSTGEFGASQKLAPRETKAARRVPEGGREARAARKVLYVGEQDIMTGGPGRGGSKQGENLVTRPHFWDLGKTFSSSATPVFSVGERRVVDVGTQEGGQKTRPKGGEVNRHSGTGSNSNCTWIDPQGGGQGKMFDEKKDASLCLQKLLHYLRWSPEWKDPQIKTNVPG